MFLFAARAGILVLLLVMVLACNTPGPEPILNTPATVSTKVSPPTPLPTHTPYPTHTPLATHTPFPTWTPGPTAMPSPTNTPYPTPTPNPTATPYPTYTPVPTPTPTLVPTPTLIPTSTPSPTATSTPTPTPTPTAWTSTGHWYRNTDWESGSNDLLAGMGINSQFYIATLDAIPSSVVLDISFSLGCIDDLKIAYMSPYARQVPPSVDVYTVGMRNRRTGAWVNDETHEYRNPVITDDGASVYLTNQAQLRQIVESMRSAIRTATPGLVLSMGMYDSTDEEDQGLWGEFDPKGLQDALQYLPCFNPTEMPAPTPSPTPTSAPSPVETKWSANEADGDPSVFLMDRGNGPVRMMVVDCASDEGSARRLALRLSRVSSLSPSPTIY